MSKIISLLLCFAIFSSPAPVSSVGSQSADVSANNLLVLGDSIAAGYIVGIDYSYSAILSRKFGFKLKNLAQLAASSDDLVQALDSSEYKTAIKNANFIEISIGGNDFLLKANDFLETYNAKGITGVAKLVKSTIANTKKNIETIVKTIQSINPKAKIIFQTLYITNIYNLYNIFTLFISDFNDIYFDTAKQYENVYVSDVWSAFKNSEINCITDDDIHPNYFGHRLIAATLEDTFVQLGCVPNEQNSEPDEVTRKNKIAFDEKLLQTLRFILSIAV